MRWIDQPFFITPKWIINLQKRTIHTVRADRSLYLTFDDGPDPGSTPKILALLNDYGIKATFFLIGEKLDKYPELGKAILDHGHMVGNHTFSHFSGWGTSYNKYINDVLKCQLTIQNILKQNPILFRPPYGRLTFKQVKRLSSNFSIIAWSHSSGDYNFKLNIDKSFYYINKVKPGSILLFHDSQKAIQNTIKILPGFIQKKIGQQWKFDKLNTKLIRRN